MLIRRNFWILLSLFTLNTTADALFSVLLPSMRQDLALSLEASEWCMSAFALGMGMGMIFWGRMVDVWGRRQAWRLGLMLASLALFVISLSSDLWSLLIARYAQGLSASINNIMCLVIIRDSLAHAHERTRAHARINQALAFAPIAVWLSMQLGLHPQNWRLGYQILSLLYAIGWLSLQAFCFPPHHQSVHIRQIPSILQDAKTRHGALLIGTCIGIKLGYLSAMPHLAHHLHTSGLYLQSLPWLGLSWILAGQLALHFQKQASTSRKMLYGAGLSGLASLLMLMLSLLPLPGSSAMLGFILMALCTFISHGLIIPNATALALSSHAHRAGTASAVLGCCYYLTAMLVQFLMTKIPFSLQKIPYLFVMASFFLIMISLRSTSSTRAVDNTVENSP